MASVVASATARHAGAHGEARDHDVVKRRKCNGFVAKSLFVEIVTWTAGCFAHSPGAFLLMYQRCRTASRGPRLWATVRSRALPHVGRVGPKAV